MSEYTSAQVASLAGKVLQDPFAPPQARRLAACALTQARDRPGRQTTRKRRGASKKT